MYPYILMIFVVVFYAGNILVGKAINDIPPITMSFFRLFFACLLLLPVGLKSAWRSRRLFVDYRGPFLLMAFTGISSFNLFVYGALQFTTTAKTSVLESIIPIVTVLLSAYLLKERVMGIQLAGIAVCLWGAVMVITKGSFGQLAEGGWNIGDTIMIGAVISWSVYSIAVKKYMPLFPQFGAVLAMSAVAVLVMLPFVFVEWLVAGIPVFGIRELAGLLYLGAFPSVIALIFFNRAVELLDPARASVFLNFLPVFTMIGAYFWLGEDIQLAQITGAFIVIMGLWMSTRGHTGVRKEDG